MSVLVELTIFPVDKGESVSKYVAQVINIIKKSGLEFAIGPMGTTLEGKWEELMDVITDCFNLLKKDSNRIYMVLKVDYRKGKDKRISKKVSSVLEKIE